MSCFKIKTHLQVYGMQEFLIKRTYEALKMFKRVKLIVGHKCGFFITFCGLSLLGLGHPALVQATSVFAVNPASRVIVEFDASSGAVLSTIPTPEPPSGGPDGLAHSGSSLFFVNGFGFTKTIYELNPTNGDILRSFPSPSPDPIDGLAFSDGFLFALDFSADRIFKINPSTGAINSSCFTGLGAIGGLAGGSGRLFTTIGFRSIVELNPDTCAVISGLIPSPSSETILGLAFDGSSLYAGSVSTNTIFELDPMTGQVLSSFPTFFPPSALASSSSLPLDTDGDGILDNEDECPLLATSGLIEGSAGNDYLKGTQGNDLIRGLGGNDKIRGLGGNDCLVGGLGNDKIYGGNGNDILIGEAGMDRLNGESGDDILKGGSGNDKLRGSFGDDTLDGGDDQDKCYAPPGTDTVVNCEKVK